MTIQDSNFDCKRCTHLISNNVSNKIIYYGGKNITIFKQIISFPSKMFTEQMLQEKKKQWQRRKEYYQVQAVESSHLLKKNF